MTTHDDSLDRRSSEPDGGRGTTGHQRADDSKQPHTEPSTEGAIAAGESPTEREAWPAEIEAIYREQGREIWALLYAQAGDADRAYDALQEAFLRLQEQDRESIRDPRAWLVRVGRNWLRDVARRQRVAAKPTEGLDTLPGERESRGEAHEQLEHEELLAQVRAGLDEMKEQDREVLVLRYALGWSSHRIAEVLGSSSSAIDMRLSRARKRLARYLDSTGVRE